MPLILNDHGTGRIPRTVLFPEAIHPSVQVSSRNRRALPDRDLRVAPFRPRTGSPANKEFFSYAPLAYSVLSATVLLILLGWTVLRFLRRLSQERAAVYIEQKQPKLRNNLINSLQLYPQVAQAKESPGFSASMVLALLRTTRKQLSTLQIHELIDTQRVKSDLRLLGFLFVPVLAMVLFNPSWVGETFSLLSRPLDYLPPSKTDIEVSPKGLRVVRGSPVTIQAATSGAIPKSLELIVQSGTND